MNESMKILNRAPSRPKTKTTPHTHTTQGVPCVLVVEINRCHSHRIIHDGPISIRSTHPPAKPLRNQQEADNAARVRAPLLGVADAAAGALGKPRL